MTTSIHDNPHAESPQPSTAATLFRAGWTATRLAVQLLAITAAFIGAVHLYTDLLEREAFWVATLYFLLASWGLYTALTRAWSTGWPWSPFDDADEHDASSSDDGGA